MQKNTHDTLRRHLRNAIYIENGFGLELFRKKTDNVDSDNVVIFSRVPKTTADINYEVDVEEKSITVEDFFKTSQNFSNEINILPYLFQREILEEKVAEFKSKLLNFPLIIIDWQLENGAGGKNGLDVFEKIIDKNDILHYYVIYSKDISTAVNAFSQKYSPQIGQIAKNEIAVINDNAIVLFCDKVTYSINDIIEQFCDFMEEQYGFLPQMFLNVKNQIEDTTALLYHDFMGLDSMVLPQLIADEVYNYEGLQEEVLISVIFNQLRNSVKLESEGNLYLKSVINKLLEKGFDNSDFDRVKAFIKRADRVGFDKLETRLKKIKESKCLNEVSFETLKKTAQLFWDGETLDIDDKQIKEKIQDFILFLSLCSDKNYRERYVKLLSLIKLTDYKPDQQWVLNECLISEQRKGICQGDVFINDPNSFLLCITPSCQLIRPNKINNTYTFLKGCLTDKEEDAKQKQIYTMHLVNQNKTKVLLIKWEFYSPVVVDISKMENAEMFKGYKRYYRLNTEYTHKLVELYTEFIKQIGVEEMFGKRKEWKDAFVVGD